MSDDFVVVDVPARFYEDHIDRDCGQTGVVVKRLSRTTRVRLDQTAYDDLLSDAEHYAGQSMSEWWEEGRGVILSARATVKVLNTVPRPRRKGSDDER